MSEHGGVIVNIIADMFRGFPMMAHTGKLSKRKMVEGGEEVKITKNFKFKENNLERKQKPSSPPRSGKSRGGEFDPVSGS